jgi:tripartite-type tricarboxylate transporter receptor subunit TctC
VSSVATSSYILAAHPSVAVHSVKELVALAKARSGAHGTAGAKRPRAAGRVGERMRSQLNGSIAARQAHGEDGPSCLGTHLGVTTMRPGNFAHDKQSQAEAAACSR